MTAAGNKRRLWEELVARGLARDGRAARALILAGRVRLPGRANVKAGDLVEDDAPVEVVPPRRYPSRGGEKLAGVLDDLGIEVKGRVVVDVGSAAGGFTACLLARGAAHVHAVDVARGALAWELRQDPRVTVREGVNARDCDLTGWLPRPDGLVADVSFISLTKALAGLLGPKSPIVWALALVKPQFEAERTEVEAGGVVRNPAVVARVVVAFGDFLESRGLMVTGAAPCRLPGPAGNREFFVAARRGGGPSNWRDAVPIIIRRALG